MFKKYSTPPLLTHETVNFKTQPRGHDDKTAIIFDIPPQSPGRFSASTIASNNLHFGLFEGQDPSATAKYSSGSAALMPIVKESSTGMRVERRWKLLWVEETDNRQLTTWIVTELGDTDSDQLSPRVTVSALTDDVLLEIFDLYLVGFYRQDAWQTLVHVCKKWRYLVFASPQRLRLQLLCTNKRPVQNTLDVWPELPIVVEGRPGMSKPQDVNNIMAALAQHNRVCKISISELPNTVLKKLCAIKMRDPFPALTFLWLWSQSDNAPALPDSFLGGSAPRLQTLELDGVPFPALPKLLLSTRDLVRLELQDIPLSGYFSPKAMVTGLSALARLQTLILIFRSPRRRADRESRLPPRLTRFVLPVLAKFKFGGDSEYLEDIVAQIDTPRLDGLQIIFFNQLIFDTPFLRHFISRTETLKLPHQADMTFREYSASFDLARQDKNGNLGSSILFSSILCRPSDWQLSSLAQICDSALFPLPALELLEITSSRKDREDDMDNAQWLEVLSPFASVKDLVLHGGLIQLVAIALEDLTGERVTEVLPALQNMFLSDLQPSETVKKAIGKFIATRQLSGCPVTVHHRETWNEDYRCWEDSNW